MIKVSEAQPLKRPQILVQIPRDKLPKFDNKWNTLYRQKSGSKIWNKRCKTRQKPTEIIEKKFVNTQYDGLKHLPKLLLKIKRNRNSKESSSESQSFSDESDDSSDNSSHYKKKIIRKRTVKTDQEQRSSISHEHEAALCESMTTNEKKATKKDSDTTKTDSNNEQGNIGCTDSSSSTAAEKEVNMPKETKAKLVVLEDTIISGHSNHDTNLPTSDQNIPYSSISSTDQNKNSIGKHILPTVMVPQQQCSRVALPLNDLFSNNISIPSNKLKQDEQKISNYPNVVTEADSKKDQNVSKANNVDNAVSTTTPTSSNVRRKKSIPVRRKSTVTDECRLQNDNDVYNISQRKIQNFSDKLYTRHNGLELLSMVCNTTTAPSAPTCESSSDLRKPETICSTQEEPLRSFDGKRNAQAINSTSTIHTRLSSHSPLNTKQTQAQKVNSAENRETLYYHQRQMQMHNNMQPVRPPPPPYDVATSSTMPYLHRDPNNYRQLPQAEVPIQTPYGLNNLQPTLQNAESVPKKSRPHNGATSEQFSGISEQQHTYYQSHHLLSNPAITKEHLHLNHYIPNIPVSQEALINLQASQKVLNPNLVRQQPSPRKIADTDVHPFLLQQHYQQQNPYLNHFVSPPFDRQMPVPPNLYPLTESKPNVQVPHQLQNNYVSPEFYELLNSREHQQWQRQITNPPSSSVISRPSSIDQNNINDMDRSQLVTLYYESQNPEPQNESNGQTIVYAEVPFTQNGSTLKTPTSQQVNQRALSAKQLPTSKETINYDVPCVPVKISNSKEVAEEMPTVGRVFLPFSPEALADMIVDKMNEKKCKNLDESQKSNGLKESNANEKTSEELPLPIKQTQQTGPSVIIQNSAVLTSTNNSTSNFSHRIENIINSTSQIDTNNVTSSMTTAAMNNMVKKTAENMIESPIREKDSIHNGVSEDSFGTQSVICKNIGKQNKYENIQYSASVNQNMESALNLTRAFLSTDTEKEVQKNSIQNSIEEGISVHTAGQNFATTKSVIRENLVDQNLESALNLSSSRPNLNDSAHLKHIQENKPIDNRSPYICSKISLNLADKNEDDSNIINYSKNRFEAVNENAESAINLTVSSSPANTKEQVEEKNTVSNNDVLGDNQNLLSKSKLSENVIYKCENISDRTQKSFCVIVNTKAVQMDPGNSYDKPSNTEISAHEDVKKQVEIISKKNMKSLEIANRDNEKQVTSMETSNDPSDTIPDNSSSDSGKVRSSNLDSEKYNCTNTNEKVKDNNTKSSPTTSEDQEVIESMNSTTQVTDKLNRPMNASSSCTNQKSPCRKEERTSNTEPSDNNTDISDVVIKKEDIKSETRNSSAIYNNHFLFDMEFGPDESIEHIFARIMPSCFMILKLINEIQNMNNLSWWPVDTSGNLLKIKLSLRGVSVFLRRSKKLAVHLDPYIHYIFLFLLECVRAFRERVRILVDTDYSLKENYISLTESDIYKDVFIQLYEYLDCTSVTDYVNSIRGNDMDLPIKQENCSLNEFTAIPPSDAEFSQVHQKHMLIIDQIRRRKAVEEERNAFYKRFILNLDRQLSEEETSLDSNTEDQAEVVSMKHVSGNQKPNSTEENSSEFTYLIEANLGRKNNKQNENVKNHNRTTESLSVISKGNLKRPVRCIVIDSDSDEEKVILDEPTVPPPKKLKSTTTNISKRVSCIINLDDDGEVSEINETINNKENIERQINLDNLDSNKRHCSSLQLNHTSSPKRNQSIHTYKKIDEHFNYDYSGKDMMVVNDNEKNNFGGENPELNANNFAEDNKDDISTKIKNMLKEENCVYQSNNRGNVSDEAKKLEKENCANLDIKEEVKYEDEVLPLGKNEDNLKSSVHDAGEQEEQANFHIESILQNNNTVTNILNKSNNDDRNVSETSSKTPTNPMEDTSNAETDETVEAIENFLREMEANDRNNVKALQRENIIPKSKKSSFAENCQNDTISDRLITNTNISTFASQTNHNNENKLVGIATPNIKDTDVNSKKTNQTSIQASKALTHSSIINVLQNSEKEFEDETATDETKTTAEDETLLKNIDRNINRKRSIIQKLISFRKPFRKSANSIDESMNNHLSPEAHSEVNETSEDINSVEDNPKSIESKVVNRQDTSTEVNNNFGNAYNQNINTVVPSGKAVNQENSPIKDGAKRNKEKTAFLKHNVEMRRYSSEGYNRLQFEHQYAIHENSRARSQDGTSTQPKMLKRSVSQPQEYSATLKYSNIFRNYRIESENNATMEQHANMAISEYFIAHELMSRQKSNPMGAAVNKQMSNDYKNANPVLSNPIVTDTARSQQFQQPTTMRTENGKELLRQAIARKQANLQNLRNTAIQPPDKRKEPHRPVSSRIPSLQSIYNESVNTNGFISQYIKEEIGVLSKKESLGPVEYVGEISTLMRLPSIPKDFKDFYVFVTKQQILQFHQPIAFHIFLELLNQSGLKDYHKKFTEYTKRKCEDNVRSRKDKQLRNHTR